MPVYKRNLFDSFINPTDDPEIELTCTVLNINSEYNTELLSKSRVLRGYMYFVNRVRDNLERKFKRVENERPFIDGVKAYTHRDSE